MATFEMFKPKIKSDKMMFNIKLISDSGRDKLTALQDIELSNNLLFIDDATPGMPFWFPIVEVLTSEAWRSMVRFFLLILMR